MSPWDPDGPNWKPSRTARKIHEKQVKADLLAKEMKAKKAVRQRDRHVCRFPLCGCRRLKLGLEVSHDNHKGMGGNPSGDRSTTEQMVLLCTHRHQFGAVSRHAGTLRAEPLTSAGYDGPVAWEVHVEDWGGWVEVARERKPGDLEPLTRLQLGLLQNLASMEL